uniref:Uncharacterized protein n=1 Tax=Oryza punctata TaxID=4537 RepID=A0A0E0JJI6_ORYPU
MEEIEENTRTRAKTTFPGTPHAGMAFYGQTMLYNDFQLMANDRRTGQQCSYTSLMQQILQTSQATIYGNKSDLDTFGDILQSPVGFQVTARQWDAENIDELYNTNNMHEQEQFTHTENSGIKIMDSVGHAEVSTKQDFVDQNAVQIATIPETENNGMLTEENIDKFLEEDDMGKMGRIK